MRYASVCSGVEAASLAWMPLGWEPIWFSEIEPFPCEVLKQRFPGVQNLGDMTKIIREKYRGTVDLLVGGTPCQGFSVAGKQGGLGDPRSALCLAYCRLLETMRPRWFVWENVPGVFSTNGGEDFRAFLRKIDEIGYSCAWRVLDAQYIRVDGYPRAVPQRRRRVFVVGYLGEWQYPAKVLFEPGCLRRDSPPRRTLGEETPGGAGRGAQAAGFRAMSIGNGQAGELGCANDSVAQTLHCMHDQQAVLCYENHAQDSRIKEIDCSPVLSAKAGTGGNNLPLVLECFPINSMIIGKEVKEGDRQTTGIGNAEDPCPTIGTSHHHAVAIAENIIGRQAENGGNGIGVQEKLAYTLNASGVMGVAYNVKEEGEFQDGNAAKINAGKVLLLLRKEIGKDTFRKWASGRLIRISEKEILQSNLHVKGFRQKTCQGQSAMDDSTLPCEEVTSENALLYLWSDFQSRYSSYRRELAQQFLDELDVCLQKLSLETPQKFKPIVRRLLPIETERLMGFPDNWTCIPWRGKPAEKCPDSPRYKACGNSMCVNVMRWIGMRIENVERKMK